MGNETCEYRGYSSFCSKIVYVSLVDFWVFVDLNIKVFHGFLEDFF